MNNKFKLILGFALCVQMVMKAQIANNPLANAMYPKANIEKILAAPNDGYQSNTHKNNIGKILFSKEIIEFDNPDESKFSNSFTNSDFINFRAYFEKGTVNYPLYDSKGKTYFNKVSALVFTFIIDSKDSVKTTFFLGGSPMYAVNNESAGAMTTFKECIFCEDYKFYETYEDTANMLNLFRKLSLGEHTVKMRITPYAPDGFIAKDIMAEGSFSFKKEDVTSVQLPKKKFENDVEVGMTDVALEQKAVTHMNKVAKANGWKETFVKAIITSEDWSIWRNENTGIITKRVIAVAVKATWPDGHCTYQIFWLSQEYNGSGYQNALNVEEVKEQVRIDCD